MRRPSLTNGGRVTTIAPCSEAQKTAQYIILELFRSRFGTDLGERLASIFVKNGRRSLLQCIDTSKTIYSALAKRVLVNSDVQLSRFQNGRIGVEVIGKLARRQRRCRDRMEHLRITTPYLRGKRRKEDLLLLTNEAYLVVEEVELYALGRILARLGRPSRPII